jgi:hypothetical protein
VDCCIQSIQPLFSLTGEIGKLLDMLAGGEARGSLVPKLWITAGMIPMLSGLRKS